jgi:DsbC/DsbD-like thiol-disulfide interchange protein
VKPGRDRPAIASFCEAPADAAPHLAYVHPVLPSRPRAGQSPVRLRAVLATSFVVALAVTPGAPAATGSAHVTPALLAETEWIEAGHPFTVGLHLRMAPGWHTYWKNPGDSGLPTRIRWTLPEGFQAGPIQWPAPHRMVAGPLASYGYDGEVLLLTEVQAPAATAGGTVRIAARVDWLECQEACLPGKAELELTLPVRRGTPPRSAASGAAFAESRRRLPIAGAAGWQIEPDLAGPALVIRPPRGTALTEGVLFFSELPNVIQYAAGQKLVRRGEAYRLELVADPNAARPLPGLVGVLVLEGRGGPAAPHALRVEPRPKKTS